MANEYDKVFKENLERIFLPFFAQVTNTDFSKTEELSLELQITLERKADFLRKVLTANPYILHLEIQSTNDVRMLSRMRIYYALLREKYQYQLPVRQYLLYIGQEPLTMKNEDLDLPNPFRYELIDIQKIPYQNFLQSEVPEMVILAILANFQQQSTQVVLGDIFNRLAQLLHEDGRLNKYARHLYVLSKLRNLTLETEKLLKTMPVIIDYTDDEFYVKGLQVAQQEDVKKLLLSKRLNAQEIASILDVPLETVKQIENALKQNKLL
ncbi:MAG: hypothetical protein EAZ95_01240 [Bacteroidetes bacterium]|nr:MAG: hypothetical protein EAZ95_01240 [Bacteroidota bacterium]